MTTEFRKLVLASISRKAKDLTDEEILNLYKSVKEKLDGGDGEGDVEKTPGPEPVEQTDQPAIPSQEETESEAGDSIDDLLKDLGLDGDTDLKPTSEPIQEKQEPTPESQQAPEQPVEQPKEAGIQPNEVQQEVKVEVPMGEIQESQEETEIPEISIGNQEIRFESQNTEAMIEKMTERLLAQDKFSPDKFITASKGQQTCRKDKDMMADGIVKPKYDEWEGKRAPRLDDRDPNAVRYKKNNENRDPETDNDKDLKLSSVDWNQYLNSTPENGGQYYGLYLPVGINPPKEGQEIELQGKPAVVQTVKTPEDIAKGRGGPVARSMRETGMAYAVNCLPKGHEWLNPR